MGVKAKSIWAEVDEAVSVLPGCTDDLFERLWGARGLRFSSSDHESDAFDEYSARLVCSNCIVRGNLLIALPDDLIHRPALLFATALIRYWVDSRLKSGEDSPTLYRPVLYFGSTIGIREQLSGVRVRNRDLDLSEVFRQADAGRKGSAVGKRKEGTGQARSRSGGSWGLPRVVTVYSPADPVGILEHHKPEWIAIDCGDSPDARWLESLLRHAKARGIWVVAWGNNPLSESVKIFGNYGEVFRWPQAPAEESMTQDNGESSDSHGDLATIFMGKVPESRLNPLVLSGPGVSRVDEPLGHARRVLLRASRRAQGPLASDALRAHWRCLNALASLSVPLDFYEEESRHEWGLEPVGKLLRSCEVFEDACRVHHSDLSQLLREVGERLRETTTVLEDEEPPLWRALYELCHEEPAPGEARLLVFTGRARKQLFALAVLAHWNITRADLVQMRTWVASLDDLRGWTQRLADEGFSENGVRDAPPSHLVWRPTLVRLPSSQVSPKLVPVLTQKNTDVLLYPHQRSALAGRMKEWTDALDPDPSNVLQTFQRLGCAYPIDTVPPAKSRLKDGPVSDFLIGTGRLRQTEATVSLWEPEDEAESLARLLRGVEEPGEEDVPPLETHGDGTESSVQESWCANALEVRFAGGWVVRFEPDELVNVVVAGSSSGGAKLDERYVRSLKPGNRVMLIHGQRRQNLYDLLISRVHRVSAIGLHVALVRKWQDEFVLAYRNWKNRGERNLDTLLTLIRERGSELTSAQTLRLWLLRRTLCPADKEDLRRLAEVLDMGFVKEHYQRIDMAASNLRGRHRRLARRLNRWLAQQATGSEEDDVLVDEELGLTFGDIRSSLQVLAVEGTAIVEGPFLRTTLGTIGRE